MTDHPSHRERKPLTPAAQRALAEAEARRKGAEANAKPTREGISGTEGPGTDALWRLGEQRHRVGFLSPESRLAGQPDSALAWEYVPI